MAHPEITEPLFEFLEKKCNARTEYQIAKLYPEIAGNIPFPDTHLPPETPILHIVEIGQDQHGRPLWHSYGYFTSEDMVFEVIRTRT